MNVNISPHVLARQYFFPSFASVGLVAVSEARRFILLVLSSVTRETASISFLDASRLTGFSNSSFGLDFLGGFEDCDPGSACSI